MKVSPESGALMGAHVSTENVPRYRERSDSAVHPEGRPNKSYKSGEFGRDSVAATERHEMGVDFKSHRKHIRQRLSTLSGYFDGSH